MSESHSAESIVDLSLFNVTSASDEKKHKPVFFCIGHESLALHVMRVIFHVLLVECVDGFKVTGSI